MLAANLLLDIVKIDEIQDYQPKKIINTINLFGQKTKPKSNMMLFNLYDDGSVKKSYMIK